MIVSITSSTPEGEPAFHHAFVLSTLAAVTSRRNNNRKARANNAACQSRTVMRTAIPLVEALMTVLLFTESDLSGLRDVIGTYRKRQHTDRFQNKS